MTDRMAALFVGMWIVATGVAIGLYAFDDEQTIDTSKVVVKLQKLNLYDSRIEPLKQRRYFAHLAGREGRLLRKQPRFSRSVHIVASRNSVGTGSDAG